jgi:hypothetical protein
VSTPTDTLQEQALLGAMLVDPTRMVDAGGVVRRWYRYVTPTALRQAELFTEVA